ncbi:hypothetical protein PLCT2_00806 [Planctomycetaceae bacterium]|nr:hypothetical protein PLCT2_00806 [Planctomycetaceae bacterium]
MLSGFATGRRVRLRIADFGLRIEAKGQIWLGAVKFVWIDLYLTYPVIDDKYLGKKSLSHLSQ